MVYLSGIQVSNLSGKLHPAQSLSTYTFILNKLITVTFKLISRYLNYYSQTLSPNAK